VKAGLIKSLEHPGGNVTGMLLTSDEAAAARVEILKKIMPSMIKLAVLTSANYPENQLLLQLCWRLLASVEELQFGLVIGQRDRD
jgi:ABC-type uncharacterized transport system substrate-binding protein